MPIRFLPNDPLSVDDAPLRTEPPLRNRPAGKAGFTLADGLPAAEYEVGTPGFVHWQCRQAALLSVKVWEAVAGPLGQWARSPDRRRLALEPDLEVDLNAYYDGASLSFFHHVHNGQATFSGASTDVVAHEAGHALLDALRPDLWDSNYPETAAFHEAFGDCVAVLVALSDRGMRQRVLASGGLGVANFVEATAEDLSDGVRRALGAAHPAAKPRRARNTFQWQLPTTLPTTGGPDVLTSEVHSFARVFTGCFYDCIRNIFAGSPQDEDGLRFAAETAARLLVSGTRDAPEVARFFQAVGRAMVLADEQAGGTHRTAVRDAFAAHAVPLGSAAMLAPRATLAGTASAQARRLPAAAQADLKKRLGVTRGVGFTATPSEIAGTPVVKAVRTREVPLGGVSASLRGVVARVAESALVGFVPDRKPGRQRAAMLGGLPEAQTSEDEVQTFVESLLRAGDIQLGSGRKRRTGIVASTRSAGPPTHAVSTSGGKKVLRRLGFR